MATKKKKECGYRVPKTGKPCAKGAKYGTSGAPRCKSHEGKRSKRVTSAAKTKVKTKKAKKTKIKALKKKSKKTVSKRGAASAKTRKTKKTASKKSKKGKKGKKRPHTKTKISFYDVKSGKNIMIPRDSCKIKRNKSTRGGDRIVCVHKGRKYSTFVARGFKL